MRYVIGIDGGASSCTLIIADLDGKELHREEGDTISLLTGGAPAEAELIEVIDRAIANAGLEKAKCAALCLGSTGAGRETERIRFRAVLERAGLPCPLIVTHDAKIALRAGSSARDALVIIAGTGSIAFGISGDKEYRAGGWGLLLDDMGSGYGIGVCALRALVRMEDGRIERTGLYEKLLDALKMKNIDELVSWSHGEGATKKLIATLSGVVSKAAQAGDTAALALLHQAASELALLADALIRRMGKNGEDIDVICSGSVLKKDDIVYPEFLSILGGLQSKAKAIRLENNAALGAVRIALEDVNQG